MRQGTHKGKSEGGNEARERESGSRQAALKPRGKGGRGGRGTGTPNETSLCESRGRIRRRVNDMGGDEFRRERGGQCRWPWERERDREKCRFQPSGEQSSKSRPWRLPTRQRGSDSAECIASKQGGIVAACSHGAEGRALARGGARSVAHAGATATDRDGQVSYSTHVQRFFEFRRLTRCKARNRAIAGEFDGFLAASHPSSA